MIMANNPAVNIFMRIADFRSLLVLVAVLFIGGCAGDMSDLQQYVETTKGKYQGTVEPLPQFEPYQNYVYAGFNYRDPFTQPVAQAPSVTAPGPQPDTQRRKEPLEFFPLDSLSMVGTMQQSGEMWGLVQDPDATIHRVQPGNHAGENYGEIIRISEQSIDLLEIIPDGLGGWIEREISLSIGEEE